MLISILLPTRNRPEWLPRAIASVLAQTYASWELILLDNSDERQYDPDDPPGRLRAGNSIRYAYISQAPLHVLYEVALNAARGELVCHFADDDELPPWALETAAREIGDADWLVGTTEIRDAAGNVITTRGGCREALERTKAGEYWLGGGVYWRKSLSDRVGGYDPRFDGAADFDLFLRFAAESDPAFTPEVLYWYTDHPATDSRLRPGNQARMSQLIAEKHRR